MEMLDIFDDISKDDYVIEIGPGIGALTEALVQVAYEVYAFEIDINTLCKYTGLTDKNGRKIFDGDILVLVEGSTHPIKVYWDGLGWKFLRNGKNIEDAFESNTIGHIRICEVIGNIFDNPEILGGGE